MTEKRLDEVILAEAVKARATDIHIDPTIDGYTVRMRIDGKLRSRMAFNKKDGERLMNQMKVTCGMDSGAVFQPASGRCKLKFDERFLDLRVSLVPCISGPKLSIRLLEATNVQQKLSTLGLTEDQSEKLKRWLFELNGMIMVTGPTGSGKTTTLYAMLKELVEEARHVVTVEDPVEYQIDGINQIEVNQHHDLTFAKSVKASLRMDPDCLMVGEIRESETAQESINAAITGHVVMATMHSRDAVSTITRLREFRLENHQIAAALGVVVNQRLIAKLCKNCSVKRDASSIEKAFFESRSLKAPKTVTEATGCSECSGTGIKGRIGIFEVWNLDEEDYQLILEGADEEKIRAKLSKSGHTYLLDDALAKVHQGIISASEVMHMGISLPWENK
jgi:general secretion pathway protein E